jgi:peptidoglycan/LPS O-acetylase OafA/YrhL
MNYDEMIEAWRAQDKAPIYRVNRDLLQVVVRQDYAKVRFELFWDLWAPPWIVWGVASLLLVVFFAVLSAMTSIGKLTPTAWDYVAIAVGMGAILLSAVAHGLSYRRQALRERDFGNSMQENVRRNLSRVDYQLSRSGGVASSLLMAAPILVTVIMLAWVVFRVNDNTLGWSQFFLVPWFVFWGVWTRHYFKKRLLEHKRRLSQLLEVLDAGE